MRLKFLLFFAALIASPAAAGTPAGDAAQAAIAAVNGSAAARASFVKNAFSTKALPDAKAAETQLRWLDKLAADSRGLTLVSEAPQGDRMVEAIIRTNVGGKFGKLVLFTSSKEPGKISNLFLLPARDPEKIKAEAWPAGKLSLAQIGSEIGKRAAAIASEDSFSGVVLVANNGKPVFRRAYGMADQDWRIPNRADTRFHLGSVGKMFTAAAILKLASEGKLSLDDPLSKWVPEYQHPEAAKITLKLLLTHNAGIGEWDVRQVKRDLSGAEAAAAMTAASEFEPGTRFSYSNAGFILLQAVIEKATGEPYAKAIERLVFKPAGMAHSGSWPVEALVANRATGYLHPEDDPLGLAPRCANHQCLGYGANGSGGQYSTADDMAAFLEAIADGKLLGPAGSKEMLAPRIDFAGAPRPSKYGYGVDLGTCAGHPMFGHEGGGGNSGVSSIAYRTLDSDWTIVVLSNYDPPAAGDLAFSICEFVAGR